MKYLTITKEDKKAFRRMQEDEKFLEKNYDGLISEYPNKWIAILNKKIVGVNEDIDALLADMRKRGIDTSKALIEFLSTTDDVWTLQVK
ncbi:hypothetical protein MSIBF_A450003 [groundwater metagenome]|uniref:DUF5678 domain-containing protein n=1 Tax=groundwater metagenome TaxID=717931 RepID=A0A098ECI4_9ZZZZ